MRKFHGEGILVTSDASTKQLYTRNQTLKFIGLSWKIENHMRLESQSYPEDAIAVFELEAQKEVMKASIPESVVDWLVDNDALYRLYSMSKGTEHAG